METWKSSTVNCSSRQMSCATFTNILFRLPALRRFCFFVTALSFFGLALFVVAAHPPPQTFLRRHKLHRPKAFFTTFQELERCNSLYNLQLDFSRHDLTITTTPPKAIQISEMEATLQQKQEQKREQGIGALEEVLDIEETSPRYPSDAAAHENDASSPPDDEGSGGDGEFEASTVEDHGKPNNEDDGELEASTAEDDGNSAQEEEEESKEAHELQPQSPNDGDKSGSSTPANWDYQGHYQGSKLQLNYDALKHIANYFLPGSHGACTDITEIDGGSFHEIRILHFEDGWSCIGRFTREEEPLAKAQSEIATIEYVHKHTNIPVPKIYFVNHNRNHVVGAAFVLMVRMQGESLSDIWDDLSMPDKLSAIQEVASVVRQLADLRFDHIGSLTGDGTVGPLLNISREMRDKLDGPFRYNPRLHRCSSA